MKKIAIIPARSGSKGLPDKNILDFCGKPLMVWSIEAAINSKCFDRVIVSTDSKKYGEIAIKYGAEVIYRSQNASSDTASMFEAVKELFNKINYKEYNYFVLLQPTSPLRTKQHIIDSIDLFENNFERINTLVSVKRVENPLILIKPIEQDLSLKYFTDDYSNYARQKYEEYTPNGAINIAKIDFYLKEKQFLDKSGIAYIMDKASSVDIDDKFDFEYAKMVKNIIN